MEDTDIFEDSSFLEKFEESSFRETNTSKVNNSGNTSALNVSALCCDEEIKGYDKLTGQAWIYPTNYPVRDYQFNIIKASIVKNTLVSLPTGLGKTFIAAVIMYNFYRWYPLGKIIFTAPTRPLVAQQIDACYNIVAVPPEDSVEMTGHMQVNTRKMQWKSKRVIFATPQVIYNDIKSGICPAEFIRCLVFDEAHRARGNYAYCQIMATLTEIGQKTFRVLALSATPGSKVEDVVNVVKNLHIAHLELRTENSIDVSRYSHTKKINTEVIQLGPQLTQLRQQYVEILDYYARRMKQLNILPQNLGNLSRGRIVMLYKEFQTKERSARHPQHNYIMKDFTLLIALYHGLELLVKHGARVFLNFFDDHPEKSWIQSDDRLTALLERLRDDLGINPLSLDRSVLPDGTVPEMPKNLTFGHPKFDRLREIILQHFKKAADQGQDTRAIVFCEYRESVNLVHCLLLQCRPLIVPQMFVGQGTSGKDGKVAVSQKAQLRAMRGFRAGDSNVLVATCVAEEGLDVGSVDLIVCFDISNSSPVRLTQRCGRTGRERGGQVYILVTEGREHQTLIDCMRQRDGLNRRIQQSKDVESSLYQANPRMVPHGFMPQCQKMHITVARKGELADRARGSVVKGNKGQKDLRTMLLGQTANTSGSSSSNKVIDANVFITKQEFDEMFPNGYNCKSRIPESQEYWNLSRDSISRRSKEEQDITKLSSWLEWQRSLQKSLSIGHSRDSEILSELLQYCDSKRFDAPATTQYPSFQTQRLATQNAAMTSPVKPKAVVKKKSKPLLLKSPVKKDGDIRALFSTATKSTKNYTKLINDLGIPNDGSVPTSLIDLLVDLSLNSTASNNICYICKYVCQCKILKSEKKSKSSLKVKSFLKSPIYPDISLINDLDAEIIAKCVKKNIIESQEFNEISNLDKIELNESQNNCSKNFDLEFDFGSPSFADTAIDDALCIDEDKNFHIGDIEDIFNVSSPEEAISHVVDKENKDLRNPKETLGFFGLDSIEDIFAESGESLEENLSNSRHNDAKESSSQTPLGNTSPEKQICAYNNPPSPSILSGTSTRIQCNRTQMPTSPILCSQVSKFRLSTKKNQLLKSSTPISTAKRKKLFLEPGIGSEFDKEYEKNIDSSTSYSKQTSTKNDNVSSRSNDKSLFTITQLVDIINKTDDDKSKVRLSNGSNMVTEIQTQIDNENRSQSPILMTQLEKRKHYETTNNTILSAKSKSLNRINESLIVLDSDSDSDHTIDYDIDSNKDTVLAYNQRNESFKSPLTAKRKLEHDEDWQNASPYFKKKQKTDASPKKTLSLQEKIIAALTSHNSQMEETDNNNQKDVNHVTISPILLSQKENIRPYKNSVKIDFDSCKENEKQESSNTSNFKNLQMFKRKIKFTQSNSRIKSNIINNLSKTEEPRADFDDSDDDFETDIHKTKCHSQNNNQNESIIKHKVRKKKKNNPFLDVEAELSGESGDGSGDELSDESVGSIIDFICDDENVTVNDDMQAVYLKSVKNPAIGMFKIPQLPKRFEHDEIFSQTVEEDAYEMDSFCVDAEIGLTQVNDMTELELAEIALEEKRRRPKKKIKFPPNKRRLKDNLPDSPPIRRNVKIAKRRISSDSDDSC